MAPTRLSGTISVTVLELMPFGLLLECLMVGVRTD